MLSYRLISKKSTGCSARAYSSVTLNPITYTRGGDQLKAAPKNVKQITTLKKNIILATIDNHASPISRLSVVLKAGSRFQSVDGLSHFTRNSLFRTIKGDTIVRTIRETELRGDTLSTTHNREHLILTTEFLRDDLVDAVPLLLNNLSNPSFAPYEFYDVVPKVLEQTSEATSSELLSDALHRVAFRNSGGLGNCTYATEGAIENMNRQSVLSFVNSAISNQDIAIVGTGISHQDLTDVVQESLTGFTNATAEGTSDRTCEVSMKDSKYFGGESRVHTGFGTQFYYMLAFPSVSYKSPDYITSLVLSTLLTGPSVQGKFTAPKTTILSPSLSGTFKSVTSPICHTYSDAGLIGLEITTHSPSELRQIVGESFKILRSLGNGSISGISETSLARAKKACILDYEDKLNGADEIASHVFGTGSFLTGPEFLEKVGSVTKADIMKLAKTVFSQKPSVAMSGNTLSMPFLDEL